MPTQLLAGVIEEGDVGEPVADAAIGIFHLGDVYELVAVAVFVGRGEGDEKAFADLEVHPDLRSSSDTQDLGAPGIGFEKVESEADRRAEPDPEISPSHDS